MKQNSKLLLIILFVSFLVRVFIIWIGRPEFVGWFNHTYYYYVETQGLLESGKLPFPDMPLLFYIYAATAKCLIWLGMENHIAIVNATRFWMCLIPSLIPIPIYSIFKNIYQAKTFPKWIWILILASAFFPLTLAHMPEFLQKNTLGLLFLAILIQQSQTISKGLDVKRIVSIIFTFILILSTHYGSTAAALLYLVALLLSLWSHNKNKWTLWLGLSLIFGLVISLYSFYNFDIQRFERIISYINRMGESSIMGSLFSPINTDKFTSIIMLVGPLGFVALLYYAYKISKAALTHENSVFWLCNILFCYLLLLPIYEPALIQRFVLFLTLPLLIVIAFTIHYTLKRILWKRVLLGFVILGTILLSIGEITGLVLLNKNKEPIHNDLLVMKETVGFSNNDLILTRNGAEHISNWFLMTKSSLITSFNLEDFEKYNRIFIMNPIEGAMTAPSGANKEIQKYQYMVSNIDEPTEAQVIYQSSHIKLLQLTFPPNEWKFDDDGYWISYN